MCSMRFLSSANDPRFWAQPVRRGACLALVALLAACASPPVTQTAPPIRSEPRAEPSRQPELAAFSARLVGTSAVPPSDSAAEGEMVAVLNRNTGLLQWKLSFNGLSGPVRGANFHSPGMAGEVAQPVLSLGRFVTSPAEGRAVLTPRQRADLLAGQWYVNLRTTRYPDGEIRGQLIEKR
ncbi:CHRD domain-containing protein [Ottowia testudinis]|uniref:CHRD domain-containing protein n=1 Tax=Ottowia testudinis TaxID=2816950 RepID=A0A975CND2_9BURK|nr:CHRD domain-containing protein [Ottowia testudinis]QTD46678.1 CHRD domain-containing protein [Ottowia testudinis]